MSRREFLKRKRAMLIEIAKEVPKCVLKDVEIKGTRYSLVQLDPLSPLYRELSQVGAK